MSAISKKLRDSQGGGLSFWCPGCNDFHRIAHGAGPGPRWTWDGDADRPTFRPSVLVRGIRSPSGADELTEAEEIEYDAIFAAGGSDAVLASRFGTVCHSYVTAGCIRFLEDCTHRLAGQTVELPDIPT